LQGRALHHLNVGKQPLFVLSLDAPLAHHHFHTRVTQPHRPRRPHQPLRRHSPEQIPARDVLGPQVKRVELLGGADCDQPEGGQRFVNDLVVLLALALPLDFPERIGARELF
jgi:hypothetical protein